MGYVIVVQGQSAGEQFPAGGELGPRLGFDEGVCVADADQRSVRSSLAEGEEAGWQGGRAQHDVCRHVGLQCADGATAKGAAWL